MLQIARGLLAVAFITISAQGQSETELWHYQTGGPLLSSPALSGGGTIYVGSYDQQLYAINAGDGALAWKFSVAPPKGNNFAYIYSSPAISPTGVIYFGTEERNTSTGGNSGTFYAVNPDGTLKWKYSISAAIYSDPSIAADGTVYFGAFDDNLYALNPDGTLKWKYAAALTIFSDPVVAADGTIYFGCDDHNLYALTSSGAKKWTFDTGGPITASPSIGPDGTVYIGTTSSLKFFAINPDGTEKWEFQATERVYSSAALGADGTVYFGSNDGKFYALNGNGTLKWTFQAGGAVRSSPAIAADGTVYVGSDDRNVYGISSQGTLVWKFPTGQTVYSSPVIGPSGAIYIGSSDNSIYGLAGSSALASTPWPMLHHDPLHTGRAVAGTANTPPTISAIADQTIQENGTAGPLNFTVSDAETAASSLIVSSTSSNTALVPNANIVFGGSGSNRTVTISPLANQSGSATITLTVTDGVGSTAKTSFLLTANAVNTPPTISAIADQTIQENGTAGPLNFTVSDAETAAGLLTVAGTSSNTALVPNANIILGGSGGSRTVTISPLTNQSGSATITLTVTDGGGSTAKASFLLTVNAVNTPPTISSIADQTIQENGTAGPLNFTVSDAETAAGSLTVAGTSSNTALVPNANIIFGGSGGSRTVTISPLTNQSGSATITLTVTDGGGSTAKTSFVLNVSAAAVSPPSIQTIDISNGTVTITWAAIAGKTYRVQYTSTLEVISWQDLVGDVLATGSTASKADASRLDSRRFYRVSLVQ